MVEKELLNPARAAKGQRSTLIGILVNVLLVAGKWNGGWLGNSYALIADAIESATDVFTSIIVWLGLRTAAKALDNDHFYGHGKAEPLAAIVVSVSLIGAAILIAVQSTEKYYDAPQGSRVLYPVGAGNYCDYQGINVPVCGKK